MSFNLVKIYFTTIKVQRVITIVDISGILEDWQKRQSLGKLAFGQFPW